MRSTRTLLAAVLVLGGTAWAYNGTYVPGDGIDGTVHDLGVAANGMNFEASPDDPLNRKCIFCHAPHNAYRLNGTTGGAGPEADAAFNYLPLWNHELTTDPTYDMYDNGYLIGGAPQTGDRASQAILNGLTPGSTSLLCLSCHDGTIAVNSYGNADQVQGAGDTSQSTGTTMMPAAYQIGADKYLGNHHPIGFNYDDAQAGDLTGLKTSDNLMTATEDIAAHLYNGNMECGTCHSVHNKGNTGEKLLWKSDQNSELCLTCHDK
jgi:predicted CXXCH cytochrome family protein